MDERGVIAWKRFVVCALVALIVLLGVACDSGYSDEEKSRERRCRSSCPTVHAVSGS